MDADAVVAAYAEAWASGDPDAAFDLYADDVVMRLPGRSPEAGVHVGRESVIAAIRALLARTGDQPVDVTPVDRLVSGDRVALVVREVVRRGDDVLDLRRVNVYTVSDGRIAEIEIYEANQYEVDAFFG